MPKAFSDQEREIIRSRLVSSGKRLLNSKGVKGLVVDDAAREAGISKGSFYSFFPSREEYIMTIFEAWEEEHRSALLDAVSRGRDSPRDRLERFFRGISAIAEREPGLAGFGFRDLERLVERLPPERLAAHQARDASALGGAAEDWIRDGIAVAVSPEALEGAVSALFLIAIHREDFKSGTYEPAIELLAEALAVRVAEGPKSDERR